MLSSGLPEFSKAEHCIFATQFAKFPIKLVYSVLFEPTTMKACGAFATFHL